MFTTFIVESTICLGEKGSRFSSANVSGTRSANQTTVTSANTMKLPKIPRQPAIERMPCPIVGAIIGTRMKIVDANDMTCAILRPSSLSRTKAIETARGAEMPIPCNARPMSMAEKFVENTEISDPTMNKA